MPPAKRKLLLNAKDGDDVSFVLTDGPVLTVTGLAFYDGTHYSLNWKTAKGTCSFTAAQRHRRGNKHGTCAVGTIWELHPVWAVSAQ